MRWEKIFCAAMVVAGAGSSAHGQGAETYAVFGREALTFQGFVNVNGAPAGSNGPVTHLGGVGTFYALQGGGVFDGDGAGAGSTARQHVANHVLFNGPVRINALPVIDGPVHSGGNVVVGGGPDSTYVGPITAAGTVDAFGLVKGNVLAGDDVNLGMGARVAGDLGSNGDVTLLTAAKVDGHVTHAGALTLGGLATVGSSSQGPVGVVPATYTPASLPAATTFASGGAPVTLNVLDDRTLAPGSYGALTFNGSSTLRLSSGTYTFDSIDTAPANGGLLTLDLDLSSGQPLRILVTGDVDLDRIQPMRVNGHDVTEADRPLAAGVLLESHGDVFLDGSFFGTIFAPEGDVTTGTIGTIDGSVLGRTVTIGSSYTVNYVAGTQVPDPAATGLLAAAAAAGLSARRRRRRT